LFAFLFRHCVVSRSRAARGRPHSQTTP